MDISVVQVFRGRGRSFKQYLLGLRLAFICLNECSPLCYSVIYEAGERKKRIKHFNRDRGRDCFDGKRIVDPASKP